MPVWHVVEPVDEIEHKEGRREDVAGQLIDAAGQETVAPAVGLANGELGGGRWLVGAPAVGLLGSRGKWGEKREGLQRRSHGGRGERSGKELKRAEGEKEE